MPTFPEDAATKDTRRTKWITFFLLLGFSALEIGLLVFGKLDFDKWRDWIILGAAVFFPVLTVLAGIDLVKDWSSEESERVTTKTFSWLIGGPITALVGLWIITSLFGWFSDIPSWAAVIIVLLVILISRRL